MFNSAKFVTLLSSYGSFTFLAGETVVSAPFRSGKHWEQEAISIILPLIRSDGNIIEVGGHVGTHTVPYAKATSKKLYVFEPQSELFALLCHNVKQNGVTNVVACNKAVAHFNGRQNMADRFPDGEEAGKLVDYERMGNFGGIHLGKGGAEVECIKLDSLGIDDVGFIHCDAQGADPLVMFGAQEIIKEHKPVLFFERCATRYYENLVRDQSVDANEAIKFDTVKFCKELGYSRIFYVDNSVLCVSEDR